MLAMWAKNTVDKISHKVQSQFFCYVTKNEQEFVSFTGKENPTFSMGQSDLHAQIDLASPSARS